MLSKRTLIDQIEVTAAGVIQILIQRQVVESGTVLSSAFLRVSAEPESDLAALLKNVNAGLAGDGWAPVSDESWARVRSFADVAWAVGVFDASPEFSERQAAIAAKEAKVAGVLTAAADRIAQLEGIVQAQVQAIAELEKYKA